MMNIKSSAIIAVLGAILALGAFYPNEVVYEERESMILHGVINFIQQVHVNPKPIDDKFSMSVYKTYLERIDNRKRFLIQDDIDKLSMSKLKIDDQVNARTLEFFDVSFDLLEAGVIRSERIFNDIMDNHEFDYSKDESIELDNDKIIYANSELSLKNVWRKYLKYDIVQKYNRKKKKQKNAIKKEKDRKLEEEFDAKKGVQKELS